MEKIDPFLKNLTILYVEDDGFNRKTLVKILEKLFKEVIVAVDGEDGLEKFKENEYKIDLVLTDIQMPNKNGLEMAKDIKNINKNLPIIVITAYNDINYLQDAISIGIDEYLFKPFELNDFLKVVNKISNNLKLKLENEKNNSMMNIFNSILQTTQIVLKIDSHFNVFYANDKFFEFFNVNKSFIENKTIFDFELDEFDGIVNVFRNSSYFEGIIKGIINNKKFAFKTNIVPIFDKYNLDYFIIICNDITEEEIQKEYLENSLKETEYKFNSYIQAVATSTLFIIVDKYLKIIEINENLSSLLGYRRDELINKNFEIFRNDHNEEQFLKLKQTLRHNKKGKISIDLKNRFDDEKFFIAHISNIEDNFLMIFDDITNVINLHTKLALEQQKHLNDLEKEVALKTNELTGKNKFMDQIIDTLPVFFCYKNEDFRITKINSKLEDFIKENLNKTKKDILFNKLTDLCRGNLEFKEKIIEYDKSIREDKHQIFTIILKTINGNKILRFYRQAVFFNNEFRGVIEAIIDITDEEKRKEEIEILNNRLLNSLKYASLIQRSILAKSEILKKYFKGSCIFWKPKDIVGGDIVLIDEINENEIIIYVIDGTGHGVSGAFLTLLSKAIKEEISDLIRDNMDMYLILSLFNKKIAEYLNVKDNNIDVGVDLGIIYFNKNDKKLKFTALKENLFMIRDNIVEIFKGSRKIEKFKVYEIDVEEDDSFFISTDGFIDQLSENDVVFGRRRFEDLLLKLNNTPCKGREQLFLQALDEHRGKAEQTDDITLVGFKV